jgi:hypothetical protein
VTITVPTDPVSKPINDPFPPSLTLPPLEMMSVPMPPVPTERRLARFQEEPLVTITVPVEPLALPISLPLPFPVFRIAPF